MSHVVTGGTVQIHSAPAALCPHVEWALAPLLGEGATADLDWTPQPAARGSYRAELPWHGRPGTGAMLASALRDCGPLRFEVTERPAPGSDGSRWSGTPELGIFHAMTDVAGNLVVGEERIRYAYEQGRGDLSAVLHELSLALGEAWDDELEPFRQAADGAAVRWLGTAG